MRRMAATLLTMAVGGMPASPLQAEPAAEGESVYVVQAGDTLSKIAANRLGDAAAWKRLQALNRIADPNVLRPGTALRLPHAAGDGEVASAEVMLVKGEVWLRQGAGASAEPAAVGAQLRAGTVIETGAAGLLTLRFADRSRLLVSPNSRLRLTQLLLDRKTGEAVTRATLEAGDVESSVTPLRGVKARYEMKTPALNLSVRGTAFRAQVDGATGATRSMVTAGTVRAGNAQGDTLVEAGYGTMASPGGRPMPPRALLPPPAPAPLAPIVAFFPARLAWEGLQDARQYRVELLEGNPAERLAQTGTTETPAVNWAHLPNGEYRLRVRGVDELGLEGMNGFSAFRVQAWPVAPLAAEPRDRAVVAAEEVRFRWAHVPEAEYLRFQVARDPEFADLAVQVRNLSRLSTGFSLALKPGRYYWRIAAGTRSGGLGPYGPVQSFEAGAAAVDGGTASAPQASLRWRPAASGERYRVQVARDGGFTAPLVDTELTVPELALPAVSHSVFVRIRRIAADGFAGEFEAAQRFDQTQE